MSLTEWRKNTRRANVKSSPRNLGSPAHRQLLSKSTAYRKGFLETQRDFKKWLENAKSEIKALPGIRGTLTRLQNAGADPGRIVHILAIEVRDRRWLAGLRTQKARIKKAAEHLRTVAEELERISAEEATYPDLWLVALQQSHPGPVLPASKRVPRSLLRNMRSHAQNLDRTATWMGEFLRRATPVAKRQPIRLLLGARPKISI